MATSDDDKDKDKGSGDSDEKRNALKALVKEVFQEVIAEHQDSGRTDKGKDTADKKRGSVWDNILGG